MSSSSPPRTKPTLAERYRAVREFTEKIAAPLSPEDCMVQSMPDTSPARWHMAHTTWFFETFILGSQADYIPFDEQFQFLFNSYYNSVGDQFPRPQRGLISRPGLAKILEYRRSIDQQMVELLDSDQLPESLRYPMEVGLNHEQQHQELMLTDIKHVLSCNPTMPVYQQGAFALSEKPSSQWFDFDEGVYEVGHAGDGFAFDNESSRHRVFLPDFALAGHPVSCGQFIDFIEDGGYERPSIGCHWAGPQCRKTAGMLLCIGSNRRSCGCSSRWPVCSLSIEIGRFVTLAILKLTLSLAGPNFGCRLNLNGNMLQLLPVETNSLTICCSSVSPFILPEAKRHRPIPLKCSAVSGNGPAAVTPRIQAILRQRERSVSTTVNSCATNTFSAVAVWQPAAIIFVQRIGIFSRRRRAGNSPGSASPSKFGKR